jgi:DNA polymerase
VATTVYFDIESRSVINLRDCGAYVYATHPSTEILCLCYVLDNAPEVQVWRPGEPPPEHFPVAADHPADWTFVSDNWDFERALLEHVLVPQHGFRSIPLAAQDCAQRRALANGYPAELGLRAEALGLPYRKDPEARKAMLAITRPKQQRKRKNLGNVTWDEDPEKLRLTIERCKRDVLTTRACYNAPQLQPLPEFERALLLLDANINDRGVRADVQFVTAARDLAIRERTAINLRLEELTDGAITTVDQIQRFLAAVNARGHTMTTLNKGAVAAVLARKPDDFVRQLLTLRRYGARASVRKFQRLLDYASPADHRLRGTLRIFGAGPGRWAGLGPQLQNLKKNESNLPLSVVDAVRAGDRSELARYGNPLALLGDISRAALCASPGHVLISADFSAIESRVLAWLAGEQWKLAAYRRYDATGDKTLEPYRVIAHKMLQKTTPVSAITSEERQLGKAADLASGFGGVVGAWRRIMGNDSRSDQEIGVIIQQFRAAHPATRRFWTALIGAMRVAIRSGRTILVAPPPRPPLTVSYNNSSLFLTLPSGRTITYPEARIIPSRFEGGEPEILFQDNAKGQWKPYRGWFGTFVENAVQGVARDLLAEAIMRFEATGIHIVMHCHDEVTAEVPIDFMSEADFLAIMLEPPAWAQELPLNGKVHSGAHYLEPPETEAEPLPISEDAVLEDAIDVYLEDTRDSEIADPVALERNDEKHFLAQLSETTAPLFELVSLPLDAGNHVSCPFHDDPVPSCAIYADHFHCYGCGEHGDRLDWLMRVEGMTRAEAIATLRDWTPNGASVRVQRSEEDKRELVLTLWNQACPLMGTLAARYLTETRGIALDRLPTNISEALRFHPDCTFGPGTSHPCLLVLMREPLSDAVLGIQRIALAEAGSRVLKLERRMLGHAGVAKLWPAGDRLVVGEGLETVLAAATRVPFEGRLLQPAWAALSRTILAALPVIAGVRKLILLVDHDLNGAGQQAAGSAKQRWQAAGRTVVPLLPDRPGTDFNDLVLSREFDAEGI